MPKAEDIFAKLAGKSLFVKIYMSEAYTQLILNESSQLLATINTPLGLAVTRLPDRVSTALAIFQRTLEELQRPVSQASIYIDDVIIESEDEADLLQTLEFVVTLFEDAGLRLNRKSASRVHILAMK